MNLPNLLEQAAGEIVGDALEAVGTAKLTHYAALGPEGARALYERLYAEILVSVRTRNVTKMVSYAKKLARERFESGYSLFEVQTAFNVLEECIWKKIMTEFSPADGVGMLGTVSTVLGAGKDAFARKYVSLACRQNAPIPSISALFQGTDGV